MAQAARHVVGQNKFADTGFGSKLTNRARPRMQLTRNFIGLLRDSVIHNQNVGALDESSELRIVAILITRKCDAVVTDLDQEGQRGDRAMRDACRSDF